MYKYKIWSKSLEPFPSYTKQMYTTINQDIRYVMFITYALLNLIDYKMKGYYIIRYVMFLIYALLNIIDYKIKGSVISMW